MPVVVIIAIVMVVTRAIARDSDGRIGPGRSPGQGSPDCGPRCHVLAAGRTGSGRPGGQDPAVRRPRPALGSTGLRGLWIQARSCRSGGRSCRRISRGWTIGLPERGWLPSFDRSGGGRRNGRRTLPRLLAGADDEQRSRPAGPSTCLFDARRYRDVDMRADRVERGQKRRGRGDGRLPGTATKSFRNAWRAEARLGWTAGRERGRAAIRGDRGVFCLRCESLMSGYRPPQLARLSTSLRQAYKFMGNKWLISRRNRFENRQLCSANGIYRERCDQGPASWQFLTISPAPHAELTHSPYDLMDETTVAAAAGVFPTTVHDDCSPEISRQRQRAN